MFFVAYGTAFAFLGGYLTALVASQYEAVHGLVLAGVLAVIALVSMILEWPHGSVWSQAAVLVIDGARRGTRRARSSAGRAIPPPVGMSRDAPRHAVPE